MSKHQHRIAHFSLNQGYMSKTQKGALLIEAMIALLIFSFGLLGLVGLRAVAIQNSNNAEERIRASMLANDMVSIIWVKGKINPASEVATWKAFVEDPVKSGLPNPTANFEVNGEVATITITWKAPSKKTADNTNQYVTNVAIPL